VWTVGTTTAFDSTAPLTRATLSGLAEEAGIAYKDVDEVAEATAHGLRVVPRDGGWEIGVTLEV
jgi:hypothetical protein